jgi:riboflavin transport system permease protein
MTHSNRPAASIPGVFIAVGAGLSLVIFAVLAFSSEPADTLRSFFFGPFKGPYYFGNFLNTTALLALGGIGMSLAFRGGVFNLGGEGQVYASALTATLLLLRLEPAGTGAAAGLSAALFTAVLTGTLIASVSGLLKMWWQTDELISSFLLSSSLVYVIDYLISGPLRDTSSFLLSTPEIAERFRLASIMPPSHLSIAFFAAPLLAVGASRFLFHSSMGYELRICGLNRSFARYGGIPTGRYDLIPMGLSGAFYGLAGGIYVVSTQYAALQGFTSGIGWSGIAVALVARNSPLLTIPAAMLFAFIESGSRNAAVVGDFSFELESVVRAAVLLLITIRIGRRKG